MAQTTTTVRACLDCAIDISGRRGNAKRCRPCAVDAEARGYAPKRARPERTCLDCGVSISDRHFNARRCEPCVRIEVRRSADRWTASKRAARLAVAATRACRDCGIDIQSRHPVAKRCQPCAKVAVADGMARTSREWRIANPWRCRSYCASRRARKRGNEDSVGILGRDWVKTLRRYDFRCAYCSVRPQSIHMDHVIPLARGGRHAIANLVPACASCNQAKGAALLSEWKMRQRRESARAVPA
jgi:5-methylcytosine-specific restriction endonuclease McrA